VFAGAGYDREMLNSLPWLDGVRLVRNGAGFAPIDGMAEVADLLGKAKFEAEHLYRTWRVVSLEHFASDGELLVEAADGLKMRFSATDDYFRQLGRLDLVLDYTRQIERPQTEINLALGNQVPVALAPEPKTPARVTPGSRSLSPTSFKLQRKNNREF